MKGLILCAGMGTRLQPLSFTQSKVLLPVANKPMLQSGIEKMLEAGIRDIGIVINRSQEKMIIEKIGSGAQWSANLSYIYQEQPKGISDALKQAQSFLKDDPFLLLLGDNLIQESLETLIHAVIREKHNASILLAEVKSPQDYGIAEIRGSKIIGFEEKPRFPKSKFAVIGAYAFDTHIFEAVHAISPSARGEYEITDALQWLIEREYAISYTVTDKYFSDVGTIERWLEANRWMLDLSADKSHVHAAGSVYENCRFIHPVRIGAGCKLKNAVIGPYVSIAAGAQIEDCRIENSILLENVRLQRISHRIKDSIFGRYAAVQGMLPGNRDACAFIVGDKASITMNPATGRELK